MSKSRSGAVIIDIEKELAKWGANVFLENNLGDKIMFKDEKDYVWFLLNWS